MARVSRLLVLLAAPAFAAAADDPRVTRLEGDVRTLQRDVQMLSRQIEQLKLQASRPSGDGPVLVDPPPLAVDAPSWVDAPKWKRLKPGMSELEVVGILGPPTSIRERDGTRELMYALEIGTSAFLAGSVVMRHRAVTEIRAPTLK